MLTFRTISTATFDLSHLKRVRDYLESWNIGYAMQIPTEWEQNQGKTNCAVTFIKDLCIADIEIMSKYK
jgi:hypothetical protein